MYALALWFGEVNQDEGWYLYAGRLVADGQKPFVDFASTQGPVMAYVYALAQPLVRVWGVAGGRLFTAILGFCTALATALLAFRATRAASGPRSSAPRVAALLAFSLLSLNLYHVYFTTIVKTYSLAGLLVVLGFLALECAMRAHSGRHAAVAGMLLALAAGVRLSAGILLPVVWLSLLVAWLKDRGRKDKASVLIGFLLGGGAALLAIYIPFMVAAPEAIKFGLLDYHSGRAVGSLPVLLVYKGGFLIRLAGAYFPLVALAMGAWVMGRGEKLQDESSRLLPILVTSVAMVTVVHLLAVFPYDDYQVFIMPLLAVAVAVGLSTCCLDRIQLSNLRLLVPSLGLVLLAHSAASPLLQRWLLAKRDRIWWPLRTETSLQALRRAGSAVRDLTAHPVLLTQDTYLAVESGMTVPEGMELGPFCYFPDMTRENAEACHVLNREMMHSVLTTCESPVAAFSGYGLAIRCPEIMQLPVDEQAELWRMIESRYEQVLETAPFGQADTMLRVFRRK